MNFLQSASTREHFRREYNGLDIEAFMIEAKRDTKGKNPLPNALREFVENASEKELCFLVINSNLLTTGKIFSEKFDETLFDEFDNAFDALNAINPVCIIDEPHLFRQDNKAWGKIQNGENDKAINPQLIFRFGATFYDENSQGKTPKKSNSQAAKNATQNLAQSAAAQGKYENLLYKLSAVDAFNQDLIKSVEISVCKGEGSEKQEYVELLSVENGVAEFALKIEGQKKAIKEIQISAKDSLNALSEGLKHLQINAITKSKGVILNTHSGDECLKKGGKIYVNDYLPQMRQAMLKTALERHFELEERLLGGKNKIKPLCLFFIENISSYRSDSPKNEHLRIEFEKLATQLMREKLKSAKGFYKRYLEASLADIRAISGGYFAKDNISNDEVVANEVREILHDKESLLSLENVRRFIFSHRTLGVGWDNPNVFTICKFGSFGSEISKLQEVGRGLRLPVNEYMSRVGHNGDFGTHYLQYIVNDTQQDFAASLVAEINEKSGVIFGDDEEKLSGEMQDALHKFTKLDIMDICSELVKKGIINKNLEFLEGGYALLKELYPQIFNEAGNLKKGKVGNRGDKKQVHIKKDKYKELKELWELINQRVFLEYKFTHEDEFKGLLREFLSEFLQSAKKSEILVESDLIEVAEGRVITQKSLTQTRGVEYEAMDENAFLQKAAEALLVNVDTLRSALKAVNFSAKFHNPRNVAALKRGFNEFLFQNAVSKFKVDFVRVCASAHPTKFTDAKGEALDEVKLDGDLGTMLSGEMPDSSFLFEELFYDSKIEKENILGGIKAVRVFTKIPKNSIKIPAAGGSSYTPDFAYVIEGADGKQICAIIESKGKKEGDLSEVEQKKRKMAEKFFNEFIRDNFKNSGINLHFKLQFEGEEMKEILNEILG